MQINLISHEITKIKRHSPTGIKKIAEMLIDEFMEKYKKLKK